MAERNALRCILPPGLLDRLARSDEEAVRRSALDALRLDSRFRIARAESAVPDRRPDDGAGDLRPHRRLAAPDDLRPGPQHQPDARPAWCAPRAQPATGRPRPPTEAYDGLGCTRYDYYLGDVPAGLDRRAGADPARLRPLRRGLPERVLGRPRHVLRRRRRPGADPDDRRHRRHRARAHPRRHPVRGQPRLLGPVGALNESVSDVFGIQVKQRAPGPGRDDVGLADRRRHRAARRCSRRCGR